MSRTRPIAKVDLLQNLRVPRAICARQKKSPDKAPSIPSTHYRGHVTGNSTTHFAYRI